MDGFMAAAALLPPVLRRTVLALPEESRQVCEELRLRRGRPGSVLMQGVEYGMDTPPVTEHDLRSVLETATRASLYAAQQQLCRGYISAPGGVRVGVCGTAVMAGGVMEGVRSFSSVSLRIPREVPGCGDGIWPAVVDGGFQSTLIASPPGGGKTTLLRELIRRLSKEGYRLAVADERGEIADAQSGAPQFDVGPRTDVMTGVPKAQGIEMLLRAMNPQIVAMDEITDRRDARALLEAVGSGVMLLATVHGRQGESDSPVCRALLRAGAFKRRIWVQEHGGIRRYQVEAVSCA